MTALIRTLLRLAVSWTINTIAILALAWVVPGFSLGGVEAAVILAAVIAVLSASLRPLLVWVALPLIVLTGGLLSLVISALFVLLAAQVSEGVTLTSFWSALVVVLGLGLVNAVAGAVLPFDDDRSYFNGVTRRTGRRRESEGFDTTPGLVMFEIDGLADPILRRAIDAGVVPTMARWIADGSHVLTAWECDLSSQTGASQAGILHGDNSDMPGFRWFEKETGRTVVSNHPNDAADNERARVPGRGLLAGGGSAVGNMFSGGAAQSIATMSRVSDNYRTRIPALYRFFADPQNYARTLYLSIHDIALEKLAAWGQRRRDERPRVARGGIYPLTRAATTVALRELGVYLTVAEMYRGVPAIYGTFVGYDEVAHHSGPERKDTMQVLRRLDKQLARLERAARHTPRPYRIVALSDHGQSPGTPFRQTYGETLHELIGRLAGREGAASGASTEDEGIAAVNVALTETIADQARAPARVARRALGGAVHEDTVDLAGRSTDAPAPAAKADAERGRGRGDRRPRLRVSRVGLLP